VVDGLSSELLGFGPDARVLSVNCDDFGMHDAINAAVVESIENGIASSCSLVVLCPAAADAMRLLRERPHIPFGIHLALIRDSPAYRWGPVAAKADVPSLLDPDTDELYTDTPAQRTALLSAAKLTEVERELRAQIDAVVDVGLAPTHLDWHCLADGRADILDLTVALAQEYGLAARVWLDYGRRTARQQGKPVVDNAFLDVLPTHVVNG
jgi:chitin disaccharide deacetylase